MNNIEVPGLYSDAFLSNFLLHKSFPDEAYFIDIIKAEFSELNRSYVIYTDFKTWFAIIFNNKKFWIADISIHFSKIQEKLYEYMASPIHLVATIKYFDSAYKMYEVDEIDGVDGVD